MDLTLRKKRGGVPEKIDTGTLFSLKGLNILGVNPPVRDFAFMDLWSKPLGLLYILQTLRTGNEVSLLDCVAFAACGEKSYGRSKIKKSQIEKPEVYRGIPRRYHHFGMTRDDVEKYAAEFSPPDVILVTSAMTYWYPGVRWAINLLSEIYPDAPVLLGGIYASLMPEHAALSGADYIVCGRCEPAAPYPAMDLYKTPGYGIVMTSFGCPFSCRYCASGVLWPRYFRRPLDDVLKEIDFQVSLGARDFAFYDDALLLDKENFFYPLCREMRERYRGALRLHTPNGLHVRQIDGQCADILFETGFKTIRLSLESIDPKVAHDSSSKIAAEEYASAVKALLASGYSSADCETYILAGLPGQDTESVKETIMFVRECGGAPKLAEFSPIPGTPYFEEAARFLPELRAEPLLQNNSVYCSYFSKSIAPDVLQELKDLARGRLR